MSFTGGNIDCSSTIFASRAEIFLSLGSAMLLAAAAPDKTGRIRRRSTLKFTYVMSAFPLSDNTRVPER